MTTAARLRLEADAVQVRPATLADLQFLVDQGRKEFECIGFLSSSCYEGIILGRYESASRSFNVNGRLWIAEVNADQVGFLYASAGRYAGAARIVQVCVRSDARRIDYGQALVSEAESWAAGQHRTAVGCHVATDIDAGAFWDALGYPTRALIDGGAKRGRRLESRYRLLPCGLWGQS
jgi:GNAT superfamily N-acetyltransferase